MCIRQSESEAVRQLVEDLDIGAKRSGAESSLHAMCNDSTQKALVQCGGTLEWKGRRINRESRAATVPNDDPGNL